MKKTLSLFAGALFWIFPATAQIPEAQPLYPQGAPDNNGLPADKAVYAESHAEKIAEADYMLFRADPSKATGQAVVICPGGAYLGVAYTHEGIQVAQWMNERGITALMLRYRMPNGHHDIPLHDARTAIALLRDHAAEWGIDPHQVGIMGFSAGGHLAAATSTRFTGTDDRPDFTVLMYAAISRDERMIDRETMGNLFGADVPADSALYSCEKEVTARTPPAFIAMSDDDDNVLPGNSICYYTALKRHGVPAELHAYPRGKHGWGWNPSFRYYDELTASLGRWLEEIGEKQAGRSVP